MIQKVMDGNGDLFLARLQLMVVMAKAYLEGLPIGKHRKQAILENANTLFTMTLQAQFINSDSETAKTDTPILSPELYERIRLLSVMGKAIAEDRLTGDRKQSELLENIKSICETTTFTSQISDMDFLHVA